MVAGERLLRSVKIVTAVIDALALLARILLAAGLPSTIECLVGQCQAVLKSLNLTKELFLLVVSLLLAVHETLKPVKQALATFRLRVGTAVSGL